MLSKKKIWVLVTIIWYKCFQLASKCFHQQSIVLINNHLIIHLFYKFIFFFHLENSYPPTSSPSPHITTLWDTLPPPANREQPSSFVAQNILWMPLLGTYHIAMMTDLYLSTPPPNRNHNFLNFEFPGRLRIPPNIWRQKRMMLTSSLKRNVRLSNKEGPLCHVSF